MGRGKAEGTDPWNCQPFQTPGINSPRNAFLLSLSPLPPLDNPSSSLFLSSAAPAPLPPLPRPLPLFRIHSPFSFDFLASSSFLGDRRGGEGRKHSQSFSPFCDSISADIAPVSLDSSIRSDEDAADEGNIFIRVVKKETERRREGGRDERERKKKGEEMEWLGAMREKERERERRGIYKASPWHGQLISSPRCLVISSSSFSPFFLSPARIARSTISVLDQHAPWCVHNVSTYVLEDQAIEDAADITDAVCKKKR